MKFTIAAGVLALAGSVAAAAFEPYPCSLTQDQADYIVGGFAALLQNKPYNGKSTNETVVEILSEEYVEYSDSILSLISKNNTVGVDGPATVGRDAWFAGVSQHPIPSIINRDILVAGDSKIIWRWTFNGVGISKYPVTGFNLFEIDENLQIGAVYIEFNSIAWGIDIFELQQYCS